MIIYIDTLICINLFIDYLLLLTEKKVLHINCKGHRIILGATFAAASTLLIFVPWYNITISLILRILSAFLIILVTFGTADIKRILIRTLVYFGMNMCMCGVLLGIDIIWNPEKLIVYNDTIYIDISPLVLITATITFYCIFTISERISAKRKMNTRIIRVTYSNGSDHESTFDCYIDTGCTLHEPFSGLPVIIAHKELITEEVNAESIRYIPYSTLNGNSILKAFKPQRVHIDGKELKVGCYIGICENSLEGEIKAITGTELQEVI